MKNKTTSRTMAEALSNGALLIASKPGDVKGWDVVAAAYNDEYVIWNRSLATGELQSGKYFPCFSDLAICWIGSGAARLNKNSTILNKDDFEHDSLGIWESLTQGLPEGTEEVEVLTVGVPR